MVDEFTERYGDLLTGSCDCVDRVVLNAFFPVGHSPGGLRAWWRRWHDDGDESLDDAHLMRLAGRFARRVRAWAAAHGIPVIDCAAGERKHRIAEDYLAEHAVGVGVFLILVARAPATVWKVTRTSSGEIRNLEKTRQFVNPYSFHIMDPTFGHLMIKMSGHPPFGATGDPQRPRAPRLRRAGGRHRVRAGGQLLHPHRGTGSPGSGRRHRVPARDDRAAEPGHRLLDLHRVPVLALDCDEQHRSGFGYAYSTWQVEYSRNLIFASGRVMERAFDTVVDRTRTRIDVPKLATLLGVGQRPRRRGAGLSPRQAVVTDRPRWNLTLFTVHFGLVTVKGYTTGEHVLRLEAIVHNTRALHTGRVLDTFPAIVAKLAGLVDRFTGMLDCVDVGFLPDGILDQLPVASQIGATRVGGIDLNRPRTRNTLHAVLALAVAPDGSTVTDLAGKLRSLTGQAETDYTARQATHNLRKLRGKQLVVKPDRTRRYHVPPDAAPTITALLTHRDHVIAPIPAGVRRPGPARPPNTRIDRDYKSLRNGMRTLFTDLAINTAA